MSAYLRVLARRAAKWEKLLGTKSSNLTHSRKGKFLVLLIKVMLKKLDDTGK